MIRRDAQYAMRALANGGCPLLVGRSERVFHRTDNLHKSFAPNKFFFQSNVEGKKEKRNSACKVMKAGE